MEFLKVTTDTSKFFPLFSWVIGKEQREARNKTSLLQNDTNQSHACYFVVLLLEGHIGFSLPAGNIETPQS